MNDAMTMHVPAALPTVLRRQAVLLLRSQRVLLLALVSLALLLVIDAISRTPVSGVERTALMQYFNWLWLIGIVWGLAVWRDETPAKRAYHTAQPVDRAVHDGSRVVAGAFWLFAVIGATLLCGIALAAMRGQTGQLTAINGWGWVNYFTAPLLMYLLATAATVALNRPVEWMLGGLLTILLTIVIAARLDAGEWIRFWSAVLHGRFGFGTALNDGFAYGLGINRVVSTTTVDVATPVDGTIVATMADSTVVATRVAEAAPPGQWLLALLLWLAILVAAVTFAATRRRLD